MSSKLYYLANTKPSKSDGGISYKIYRQINIMKKGGMDVKFCLVKNKTKFSQKVFASLPFCSFKYGLEELNNINEPCDFYIRYFFSDFVFINKLKLIKTKFPKSKIAVEIPTYPYDGEKMLSKRKPGYWKDQFWRRRLYRYVDKIITFSNDDYIFNIPTINISNGVDIQKISIRQPENSKESINLLAVAKFGFWHGYDRLIEGLYNYYRSPQKKNVNFYIVGYGNKAIENEYRELIKRYKLQKHVFLLGKKTGAELDALYNKCDIGIDSMGRHRSHVFYNSSLKGKEYLAKGLPIVSGVQTELDSFKAFDYYLRVPADDSPIEIERIVSFYNKVYDGRSKSEVASLIRQFCEENFDIDKCFDKVIKWYKEN